MEMELKKNLLKPGLLYFFTIAISLFYIQKAVLQMKYCTLQLQESIETMDSQAFSGPGGFDLGGAYVPLGHLLFQGK